MIYMNLRKMRIIKSKLGLVILTFIYLCTVIVSCSDKDVEIRILSTTDVHGNLFPINYIEDKASTGGYSRLSTLLKTARAESPNLLLFDNGDLLQGEPITYYSNYIDTNSMNVVAKAINLLKYDLVVVGNHDIEPGLKVFNKWKKECSATVLGANVIDVKTGKPYIDPYKTFFINGIKIVVIGVVTPAIPQWVPKNRWEGLNFIDIKESLISLIPQVKKNENPDILIVSMHSGFNGHNSDYIENAAEQVASEVKGIDLIISGHDHQKYKKMIKSPNGDSIMVINPSNHLDFVSDIRISIERKYGKIIQKKIQADFIDINKYEPDEEFLSSFDKERDSLIEFLNKRVGVLSEPIDGSASIFGSSAYMTLIHNMQLYTMNADISFAAPLSVYSKVNAGDIKVKDIFKFCPFTNYLYVLELTGKQIQGYLEHSYRGWVRKMNNESDHMIIFKDDFSPEDKYKTKTPIFNFSSAQGLNYTVNLSKDPVEVYVSEMSNGEPFDLNKKYKVVMTSYRAGGAGGMLTKGSGITKEDLSKKILSISPNDQLYNMIKYLEVKGVINTTNADNWHFIPSQWIQKAKIKDRNILFGN